MASINDTDEQKARAVAVGTMLHYIAEGLMEGVWKDFKFKVRQHRTEKRHFATLEPYYVGPSKIEITFNMDVDELKFKADIERRKKEVSEALKLLDDDGVGNLLEHEEDDDGY